MAALEKTDPCAIIKAGKSCSMFFDSNKERGYIV
jgi:hypothetical protein